LPVFPHTRGIICSNDGTATVRVTRSEFDKMPVKSIAVFVYGITDKTRTNESGRKETASTEIDMFSAITKLIKKIHVINAFYRR